MKPNERTNGYVPLASTAESGNLLLPTSLRALACMRLMDQMANAASPGPWTVLIDPTNADIKLQESAGARYPLEETPPEGTSWSRSGYALAVNMAYILMGAHPYKGRKWYESPILSPRRQRELFVEKPESILTATGSGANTPQPLAQAHVVPLYNSMPKEMRDCLNMKAVFGLPDGRPWFDSDQLQESIARSGLRDLFWTIWSLAIVPGKPSETIMVGNTEYRVQAGKRIVRPDTLEEIGHVTENPTRRGQPLMIVNTSNEPWIVEKANPRGFDRVKERTKDFIGYQTTIQPGQTLEVTPGMEITYTAGYVNVRLSSK